MMMAMITKALACRSFSTTTKFSSSFRLIFSSRPLKASYHDDDDVVVVDDYDDDDGGDVDDDGILIENLPAIKGMDYDENILKSMTKMTLQIKNFDNKVLMIKL